jgi:Rrf2 family protein
MISTTCQYALRALAHLDRGGDTTTLLARDIAEMSGMPRPFLSKILQTLAQHGFVRSQKGPGGGFVLGRRAQEITVGQVIVAVDGSQRAELHCVLRHEECSVAHPCRLHEALADVRNRFTSKISSLTVRDISEGKGPSH